MNNIHMQKKSPYSSAPLPGSPRQTEAWALTESARRMSVSLEAMEKAQPIELPAAKRVLRDSVRLNWRLWTIFQAELTLENSTVPLEMRHNMLTLCQFVDNQTVTCLAKADRSSVEPLIGINRNLASGLMENVQETTETEEQAAPEPSTPSVDTST